MCIKAVDEYPRAIEHVSDKFKTQAMHNKAVDEHAKTLEHVTDHLKTNDKTFDDIYAICSRFVYLW